MYYYVAVDNTISNSHNGWSSLPYCTCIATITVILFVSEIIYEVIAVDMLLIQGNNKVNSERREWQEIKSNVWLAYRTRVEFNTQLHCH